MFPRAISSLAALCLLQAAGVSAAVIHYVDLNSPGPVSPYTSWATAATNIQDAIDAASSGDQVLVTNGLYMLGGRLTVDGTTNRVVVSQPLTLQSVNGPSVTVLDGGGLMRCVYLTNGATLSGFTLTNGRAGDGGGINCASTNAFVSNCVLAGNLAGNGGGASSGTLNNCVLSNNVTPPGSSGGGAANSVLNGCLLSSNWGEYGGGAFSCILNDCLISGNAAGNIGGGTVFGILNNCTVTGNTAGDTNNPGYGGGCYGGTAYNSIVYYNISSTGSNEDNYQVVGEGGTTAFYDSCTMPLPSVGGANLTNTPLFVNLAGGDFHLQFNSPCVNAGNNAYVSNNSDFDGNLRIVGGTVDMGAYEYRSITHYVDLNSANAFAPYANWATAATNIQDAIDTAAPGDTVLVTNGVYQTGGRVLPGYAITNRVLVGKAVTVQSVNGPAVTIIRGYQVPVTTNDVGAVRCVYLTNGAALAGFTLTNGATLPGGNDTPDGGDTSGGGLLCQSANVTVSNCVLAGNTAGDFGGGADRGTFYNCLFWANWATPGNGSYGGASIDGVLINCTLVGNLADTGGGLAFGSADNCIIYYNGDFGDDYAYVVPNNTCTEPDPGGIGDTTNAPLFVDLAGGNFHLQSNSPCINSGNNSLAPAGPDLDGNPRIAGGTVDMGVYEYQSPTSLISYAWLQQYGLATDGSADFLDTDGDGMNNWQEWRAGTDPTDPSSLLLLLSPAPSGSDIVISWQSANNVTYYLQRSDSLGGPPNFQPLATNIVGQAGTTSYTDPGAATNSGPFFYRVGVQ